MLTCCEVWEMVGKEAHAVFMLDGKDISVNWKSFAKPKLDSKLVSEELCRSVGNPHDMGVKAQWAS